ncbi:prolyl oligopeptidase family serine peptidase, partial [candidate division GN15 bacterium]|nr:prolyl oligopeptidase family serine peptidase [candidate division GN15 bacterium]
ANIPSGYTWNDQTIYFTSSQSGARQVYRLTPEGWPYQLTTFEDGIDFFVLSWGGTLGIVGASVGGSEQSQLFLIDTRTGQITQLTHANDIRYAGVLWAKDDESIFYSSNEENMRDFNIFQMSVVTGETRKVFGNDSTLAGSKWVAEISQDGSKLIVMRYNSNVDTDMWLVDINSGEYQKLNDDDRDVIYDSPTLMPDNTTIWLTCNDNEDGITRLARMEVGSPEVEFINDGWVDPRWEIQGLGFSRDYKYMRALVNEEGYVRMKIREVESKKELPSPPLDGQLGGGAFASDGSMLISFNGPTRAPDCWRWVPQTGELTQLTFSTYAGIDRALFTEPKLVHFESFDGLEIPAFLYLPPTYEEGEPIPFVVHAHGGPESQFRPVFLRNFQYMLLNGYGLLAVNPRGSSGYGREFLNLDNYHNRKNSLKDYKAGVDWLIANNYTEKGMIGIRGGSYGGYVTLGMITEYPQLFSAAIDVVGIANFKTFLENTRDYRRHLREAEYGPLSDPEFLASISPIHKADLIETPLLVIHGENDPRVPIGEARQIIAAVQANGGIVDSLIFADEGHGTGKRSNTIAEYRKQVEFLDKHLKSNVIEPTNKPED